MGKRQLPSTQEVFDYWANHQMLINIGIELWLDYPHCIVCASTGYLHKCHILAASEGGSDEIGNLHILCPNCHTESEMLTGDIYWSWLQFKHQEKYKPPLLKAAEKLSVPGYVRWMMQHPAWERVGGKHVQKEWEEAGYPTLWFERLLTNLGRLDDSI